MSDTFSIGIDLGTTHCALSFIDLDLSEGEEVAQSLLPLPQTVSDGEVDAKTLLPSFLYLPHGNEFSAGALSLPWSPTPARVVGTIARKRGSNNPTRMVSSAKSWLCHPGVDRRAKILPAGETQDEIDRVSPLEASAAYLSHVKQAWNHKHPNTPLSDIEVVLTVPASFDPAARELTAEAAALAGIEKITLLEEPQAALYCWLQKQGPAWRDHLKVGEVILVVDVGGGTTDFSLIKVVSEDGALSLQRIAVGDHILLGGDNMDLAMAYAMKTKLEENGKEIDLWQLTQLTHVCRDAKEKLLSENAPSEVSIAIAGRGSKLIASTRKTVMTREDVERVLVEGFFPKTRIEDEEPQRRRAALTQFGLPYASDAAITRHLASFLKRHRSLSEKDSAYLAPTAILFNGGVLKSDKLSGRVHEVLSDWSQSAKNEAPRLLDSKDLDHAVATGAAYYGYTKLGGGVRIKGGTSHAYYVGVEEAAPAVPGMDPPTTALCVAPYGLEEGSKSQATSATFGLVVGEPVRFRFFASSLRRDDVVGDSLRRISELEELGSIEATLSEENGKAGQVVAVQLAARVTEIGTLLLEAFETGTDRKWRVELNVRNTGN